MMMEERTEEKRTGECVDLFRVQDDANI